MPVYTDKRTGKKYIQYQIGYKYVPDNDNPGTFRKRPKYKTEVIGKSARVAKRVLAKRQAEWEAKKYQDELEAAQPAHYTFDELVTWYLQLPRTKAKRSYRKDVERSKPLLSYFGGMRADKIKPSMVESFQYEMLSAKSRFGRLYKPGTVNRMVALMKRIFNLAIREDMVVKNPCWKVSMLPEDNKRDRILSSEELERLLRELPKHQVPIVLVGYYTGMRLGEILGLTWSKVNLKESFIDLEAEDTKTAEPRRIYLNDVLKEVFAQANKVRNLHHDFVFTYRNKPIQRITRSFQNAYTRAGLTDFTFHDLRHTFNTNMRKAGVDQSVIMKMTGHRTAAMFERYNTVDKHDAIDAMARLDGFLSAPKSPESPDIVQTGEK